MYTWNHFLHVIIRRYKDFIRYTTLAKIETKITENWEIP